MLESPDGIENAYDQGVTMGAELAPSEDTDEAQTPNFIVMASADLERAASANPSDQGLGRCQWRYPRGGNRCCLCGWRHR